jgi:hypothetical protein
MQPNLTGVLTMKTNASEATAKGRYFWELIFSFANEENEDVNTLIKREIDVVTRRSINSKQLRIHHLLHRCGLQLSQREQRLARVQGCHRERHAGILDPSRGGA